MLQDTELWSVLEVSRHTRKHSSPMARPHGEGAFMLCRLGLPIFDLFTDGCATFSTPG